jgi:hypothetical protein
LAGIIYLKIFYLKCFWEGLKTPSFAHKLRESESGLAGVERKNVFEYLLFEMPLGRHLKKKIFASKIEESRLSGVCGNNII